MTDDDFSSFALRMTLIEDGTSLVKANTVFSMIVLGFLGVPFKYQGHQDTFPS